MHPLLITRGVPGTHDVGLGEKLLQQLAASEGSVAIPRFDKLADDRFAQTDWTQAMLPLDLVILEGWCVGVRQQAEQDLERALNDLEKSEDSSGEWRGYVNTQIADYEQHLWPHLDRLIMLRAPDFEQVLAWRTRQEERLLAISGNRQSTFKDEAAIRRFISHYERLTRWMLKELPRRADWCFQLGADQRVLERIAGRRC